MVREKIDKSEDPYGNIRDITPHVIHDSKGLTPSTYVAFHKESRGYDPPSYEFYFFEAGQRAAGQDPEVKK